MLSTFFSLAVCLEAIVHAAQQLADSHRRNFVTQFFQLLLKIAQTAGGPQNDPHRVASSHWLYKPLKIAQESRVLNFLCLASRLQLFECVQVQQNFCYECRKCRGKSLGARAL